MYSGYSVKIDYRVYGLLLSWTFSNHALHSSIEYLHIMCTGPRDLFHGTHLCGFHLPLALYLQIPQMCKRRIYVLFLYGCVVCVSHCIFICFLSMPVHCWLLCVALLLSSHIFVLCYFYVNGSGRFKT